MNTALQQPAPIPSDSDLVREHLAGNSRDAFAELMHRHASLVYSTALRHLAGDRQLAEDVTQKVFTDFLSKTEHLKTRKTLAGWFYYSARFTAAQQVRAEQRRRKREQEAQRMHELENNRSPDWQHLHPLIDEALDKLSDSEKDSILLRYFENRPYAELAARFHISTDAARMRTDRALGKIKTFLEKRGVPSTASALSLALTTQASVTVPAGLLARLTPELLRAASTAGAASLATQSSLWLSWKFLGPVALSTFGLGVILHAGESPAAHAYTQPPALLPPTQISNTPTAQPPSGTSLSETEIQQARRVESRANQRVEKLNALVGLTEPQKDIAADIYAAEALALQIFTTPEDRLIKGAPIREDTRDKLRSILTPTQLATFEAAPQRLGGASTRDPAALVARVDERLALSDEQVRQLALVFANQVQGLQALTQEQLEGPEGIALRQKARKQLLALLTPEQRSQYASTAQSEEELELRTALLGQLSSTPGPGAQLGRILHVHSFGLSTHQYSRSNKVQSSQGTQQYELQGTLGSRKVKVSWERPTQSAPLHILSIE